MPNALFDSDIGFPSFSSSDAPEQKIDQITNYLYMLLEQLRYSFSNIGVDNINDSELTDIGDIVTAPVNIQIGKLSDTVEGQSGAITTISNIQRDQAATINLLSSTQSSQGAAIANLILATDDNSAKIGLVVTTSFGETMVNAASIVAAVNRSGSSIMLDADKILLSGGVSFTRRFDGNSGGATIISGNTFTIQGICNNASRDMYQIKYDYDGLTPYVDIDSPYDAYMRFGFRRPNPRFEFYGTVDLSHANVIFPT